VAGKDSGEMLPTGATLDVTEQQRSRAGTENNENIESSHKEIENGFDATGSTKRAEPKPKLWKDDIFKERERIARFQRKSSSLTKSTYEQGLESAKSKISPSEDHLAAVKDQKLSQGAKRRLLPGTLLLLPQEEYKYIEYPATPPPSQSDSPCPGPWQDHCQQRNDTCWVPGEPDISCPDFGLCCFDGCANRCIRLRKEAGGLSSDQKALSSQDNGENTKAVQNTRQMTLVPGVSEPRPASGEPTF